MYHPTGSWATAITMADMAAQDRWYHMAVVRQGNTMSSYLDGTLRKQGPGTSGRAAATGI